MALAYRWRYLTYAHSICSSYTGAPVPVYMLTEADSVPVQSQLPNGHALWGNLGIRRIGGLLIGTVALCIAFGI